MYGRGFLKISLLTQLLAASVTL